MTDLAPITTPEVADALYRVAFYLSGSDNQDVAAAAKELRYALRPADHPCIRERSHDWQVSSGGPDEPIVYLYCPRCRKAVKATTDEPVSA